MTMCFEHYLNWYLTHSKLENLVCFFFSARIVHWYDVHYSSVRFFFVLSAKETAFVQVIGVTSSSLSNFELLFDCEKSGRSIIN